MALHGLSPSCDSGRIGPDYTKSFQYSIWSARIKFLRRFRRGERTRVLDSKLTSDDSPADIQDSLYEYPYHYLPRLQGLNFSQHRYWSWGYRYLGRLRVTFDLLKGIEFDSLLDIGCGDGRFLKEAAEIYTGKKLSGIDKSPRAIALARRLNPEIRFETVDILDSPPTEKWDVVTMLEVLEHIPPSDLSLFLGTAAGLIKTGGHLVLTVPHVNEKLSDKHYQHFNPQKLEELLLPDFEDIGCIPFDHISPLLQLAEKLMGGSGRFFLVTHQGLNNLRFQYYMRKCLYPAGESRCRRVACLARKPRQKRS